jgi:hypothetical protein
LGKSLGARYAAFLTSKPTKGDGGRILSGGAAIVLIGNFSGNDIGLRRGAGTLS